MKLSIKLIFIAPLGSKLKCRTHGHCSENPVQFLQIMLPNFPSTKYFFSPNLLSAVTALLLFTFYYMFHLPHILLLPFQPSSLCSISNFHTSHSFCCSLEIHPPYRMWALVWTVAQIIMWCSAQQMLRTVVIGKKSYSKRFYEKWGDLSIQVMGKDGKYFEKSNTKELIVWPFTWGKAIFIFYLSFSHQFLS